MLPIERLGKNDEVYPPHLLAQEINNRASFLLMTRNYGESIVLLTKALKLTQKEEMTQSCSCKSCCLESSVNMQEDQYCSLLNREREEYCNDQNRNEDEGFRQSSCQRNDDEHIEMKHNYHGYCAKYQQEQDCLPMNIESQDGFVYRKPLLIPRICIEEGHYMGKATSLIILYNLALAHHLKALTMNDCGSDRKIKVLEKSLKLYELTYQLQSEHNDEALKQPKSLYHPEECNEQRVAVASIRFTMIISNNLGQIHRLAGNSKKHLMCLQHLLSTIMYMVDSHLVILDSSEMDGFYHNVSPLMIPDYCARAA